MQPLVKAGLAGAVVATTGGGAYGIYDTFLKPAETSNKSEPITPPTKKYSEIFKGTLLSTANNDDQEKWTSRLASLKKADENTLETQLAEIKKKDGEAQWTEVRDWCKGIIDSIEKQESKKEYENIQNYCTFSIKEKITNSVTDEGREDENNTKWATAYNKLKAIGDEDLNGDNGLIEAKKKSSGKEGNTAVKDWCTKAYEKPYKGDEDNDFKNANRICLSQ